MNDKAIFTSELRPLKSEKRRFTGDFVGYMLPLL